MSLHWDPDLENNKPWTHTKIAWHSDLQWCITIPRFGFKKLINLEDILQNRTDSLKFWTFNCDLDHKCSNPIVSQDSSAYDDLPSNYVWIQKKIYIKITTTTRFVMFYYVLLYLYILAFPVLKYLSFLLWNSSDPKDKFSFYAFIMNNKVLLCCICIVKVKKRKRKKRALIQELFTTFCLQKSLSLSSLIPLRQSTDYYAAICALHFRPACGKSIAFKEEHFLVFSDCN